MDNIQEFNDASKRINDALKSGTPIPELLNDQLKDLPIRKSAAESGIALAALHEILAIQEDDANLSLDPVQMLWRINNICTKAIRDASQPSPDSPKN